MFIPQVKLIVKSKIRKCCKIVIYPFVKNKRVCPLLKKRRFFMIGGQALRLQYVWEPKTSMKNFRSLLRIHYFILQNIVFPEIFMAP